MYKQKAICNYYIVADCLYQSYNDTVSKIEKLIKKLKSCNSNFTYQDLKGLLTHLGYIEDTKGKTSGSRVAFINQQNDHIIRLHKPHPGNKLKSYQIDLILKELIGQGVIK